MCQQKTCLRSGGGFSSYQKTSISQGFHPERVMEIETAPPCRELLREDQYFTD
jgi:hypothetical protein